MVFVKSHFFDKKQTNFFLSKHMCFYSQTLREASISAAWCSTLQNTRFIRCATHLFFARAVSEARIAAEGCVFSLVDVCFFVFSTFDAYVFRGGSSGLNVSIPAARCSLFTIRNILGGPAGER